MPDTQEPISIEQYEAFCRLHDKRTEVAERLAELRKQVRKLEDEIETLDRKMHTVIHGR